MIFYSGQCIKGFLKRFTSFFSASFSSLPLFLLCVFFPLRQIKTKGIEYCDGKRFHLIFVLAINMPLFCSEPFTFIYVYTYILALNSLKLLGFCRRRRRRLRAIYSIPTNFNYFTSVIFLFLFCTHKYIQMHRHRVCLITRFC